MLHACSISYVIQFFFGMIMIYDHSYMKIKRYLLALRDSFAGVYKIAEVKSGIWTN